MNKNFNLLILVAVFEFVFVGVKSAKILGIFYVPSYSHQVVFQPIYKELSLRGHNVTVITPNVLNDKALTNLTEIDISYVYTHRVSENMNTKSYTRALSVACQHGLAISERVLQDARVANICSGEKYDLILVQQLYPIFFAFGTICNAPIIAISSFETLLSGHSNIGNPIHPALWADLFLPYGESLSIPRKIMYTYLFVWYKIFYKFTVIKKCNDLKDKYLDNNLPDVADMERNASMLFINTNMVINNIRPLVPATVTLGFMHIKPNRPLPEDLQTILDNASQGAVYFSLGSNVRSSELPPPTVKLIKEALSEIPYTVLWKWETVNVPDVGPNVITRKWFPQQDILAHKNLKGFVTQGGLQSTEEAINYGVPMVGIPFLGDQEMNVKQSMKQGISLYLDHRTMSKDDLKKSIIEIMENPKYFTRIQELKEIAQDQPMTGLERAVWWSEYVIRHKGAKHLRSPVVDMPMWEYLMLDVIAVVLSAFIIISYILYKLIKILFRVAFSRFRKVKKE